jgi:DNA polymerase-1
MKTLVLVDGLLTFISRIPCAPDLQQARRTDRRRQGLSCRSCAGDVGGLYGLRIDAKGKTFRDDWYPQYKAHRPPMPDDLVQQIAASRRGPRNGLALLMIDGVGPTMSSGPGEAGRGAGVQTIISTMTRTHQLVTW